MTTFHLGTDTGYTPFCQSSGAYRGYEDRAHTIPVFTRTIFEPDRWCPACLKVLAEVRRKYRDTPYMPPLKRTSQQMSSCGGSGDTKIV